MPIWDVIKITNKNTETLSGKVFLNTDGALLTYTLGMGIWFGENVRSQDTRLTSLGLQDDLDQNQ